MVVHAFNHGIQEAQASGALQIQEQPGLQSQFQASQGYIVRHCLSKTNKKKRKGKRWISYLSEARLYSEFNFLHFVSWDHCFSIQSQYSLYVIALESHLIQDIKQNRNFLKEIFYVVGDIIFTNKNLNKMRILSKHQFTTIYFNGPSFVFSVCLYTCHREYMWRSEESLQELVLSTIWTQTLVVWLGRK